ncbi:MAG: chemotaxis protein [Pirellulales bacterium]
MIEDTGILLDAGTNEAEILVFVVGNSRYGVNVAKVREVLTIEGVTKVSQSHPAVEGVVQIRDQVAPLVCLHRFLEGEDAPPEADETMILLDFNNQMVAFRVKSVDRIFRVSWERTRPVPSLVGSNVPVTGIIELANTLVQILDFETITAVITDAINDSCNPDNQISVESNFANKPIVFVDDSMTISRMVLDSLRSYGFTNLKNFNDGLEAWTYLSQVAGATTSDQIRDQVAAIITDIEMPRMDGFSLTKKIRENSVLQDLPVILFSSIVSSDNEKKGRQVGASAQLTKPKYDELTKHLVDLLSASAT